MIDKPLTPLLGHTGPGLDRAELGVLELVTELIATKTADAERITELRELIAVVSIHAASINPSDLKNLAGDMEGTALPRIPGRDFAGTVVAGPAEWIGAEVWEPVAMSVSPSMARMPNESRCRSAHWPASRRT